jgi:hypothetical protein
MEYTVCLFVGALIGIMLTRLVSISRNDDRG